MEGSGWTAVQINNTDNQDAALEITSQGVSNYVYTDNTGYLGLESAAGQPITLATDGSNERMRILSDGKVGIGTTAPDAALHIRANSTTGQLIVEPLAVNAQDGMVVIRGARDNVAPSSPAKLRFENYDNNGAPATTHTFGSLEGQMTDGTTNVGDIVFRNSDDGLISSLSETMRLTKDGKVDINDLISGVNGAVVLSDNTGELSELNFTGSSSDALLGDGTFGPAGGTDDQALSLSGNTLTLEDGGTVGLAGYLDNTDAQDLSLSGNTLSLTGDGTTVDLSGFVSTDDQALSLSGNTLTLEDGGTVGLAGYLDNTDAQDLSLSGNTLSLTGDGTAVDLSGFVSTDDQALSLSGNTLTLEDGGTVGLAGYLDNTDAQDLSLSGNTLSLTGDGTTVDLSGYLNADNHVYDGGSTLPASSTEAAIDALDVAVNAISDDWTLTGSDLSPNSTAWEVGIGIATPTEKLHVRGNVYVEDDYLVWDNENPVRTKGIRLGSGLPASNTDAGGIWTQLVTSQTAGAPIFRALSTGGAERLRVEHDGYLSTYNTKFALNYDGTAHVAGLDGHIYFQADAYLQWDESADEFIFPKDLRVSTLSGIGNRMVIADASGVLATQAITVGDITGVTAGTGLTGGGTSGTVTINAVGDNGLTTNANDIDLGGALNQNTTIAQGGFTMDYTASSVDAFSVDGTTFSVDAANNRVGVGSAAPTTNLYVYQNAPTANQGLLRVGTSADANRFNVDEDGDVQLDGDITVSGSDVRDGSGNLRLSGEDNLYLSMDYNNNDANTRMISFGRNDEGGDGNYNELMRIEEDGNVVITDLAGVGTRMVVASATGLLSSQAITVGDITGVTAGAGLTGGGTSGTVTLNVVATNGLHADADAVHLGGTLTEATTVTQGALAMNFNLNSTGDFNLLDNGTIKWHFRDDGVLFHGSDHYWRDGTYTGTNLMNLIDDGNDARLRLYENGVVSVDLDMNSQFIFNEQGLDRDFRVESDGDANMLFVDAGTNRVGIGTGGPGYELDVVGNTHTSGDFYGDVHVDDTRAVNDPPTTYNNEVAFDFKARATISVPGSGTYSGNMTFAPWGDNSGDASYQMNFNEGGLYWRQGQPDNATWGTWYQILTTANAITGITAGAGLTGGGTNGTVNLDVVATNGLHADADAVHLGGALTEATTITSGNGEHLTLNLAGDGDFVVQDAGVGHFSVLDNGNSYFGSDVYWRDENTGGTHLMNLIDDGNDGRLRLYENGVVSVDLDMNSQFIFNEQGLDRDFRVESDGDANMLRVDAGANRVGIGTASPTAELTVDGWIGRTAHNNGGLAGSYNSVGANSAQSNPIYIIGTSYKPAATTLSNMYGIGYSHTGASFINDPGPNSWGMYVAADGDARIWLGASNLADSYFNSGGNVGIGNNNPDYKLQVTGRLRTTGINETSDVRLKKDIEPISDALSKVLSMDGVTYNWKTEEYPDMGLNDDLQHGLIAQELEKIVPELVLTDKEGWKSIEYTHLVPILVEAIKEQQIVIAKLESINDKTSIRMNQLESALVKIQTGLEEREGKVSASHTD